MSLDLLLDNSKNGLFVENCVNNVDWAFYFCLTEGDTPKRRMLCLICVSCPGLVMRVFFSLCLKMSYPFFFVIII